jgi:DNA-binding response OmpR family regulator
MPLKFQNLSVLVVEDTPVMKELICAVLENLGVGYVNSAPNGELGFEVFNKSRPDIVITDWMMEPVSGVELTKKIRRGPGSVDRMVPIILLTGYSAVERVSEARDAGVTEFLVKPFTADDLAKRLSYVINNPRDFIDYDDYFGPDRRRIKISDYKGPKRRRSDEKESQ